ncbi:putative ABC transport system permease protein [Desulfonatronum thiosulfatophilum]|uniref:Putative ABC transport system permease protein n=1 Tax=Desulfonatronum thiosulfatophilum TaxID=617002 RepID=A0A1G6C0V4_9BACT|nr:FtsX-like permease family protein [Desulfonatronum thiosulfatophilum]SDB26509.1 putative ABC transport system permease protein [Desulfonatronum thiosulfatophilum]
MSVLTRKLLRELLQMRGQALAIAVVIAGGVATLVMSLTSLESLTETRDVFYRDSRFSHVFASLKRAPHSLEEHIRAIPGVQVVETRIQAGANLDIPDYTDPATGQFLSLPDGRNAELNSLFLRSGRLPRPGQDRETVVGEAFAEAHGFQPGDQLAAIINGRRQELEIVGVALSPEFIYHLKPGDMFPDFERHGIFWMNRSALAAAYDLDGAFNDVILTVSREARIGDVLERLDALLEPYGGLGAVGREEQLSHRYLSEELNQLANMATLFPTIFLGVAAFLLNVVFSRLISTQREQIAILKAFGYSNFRIGMHYTQMALLISLFGLALGVAAGGWLGQQLAEIYRDFFRFPYLEYHISPRVITIGAVVTLAASLLGALFAVRKAVGLPPAEAMRPEPPPVFRITLVERLGLQRFLAQPTRMILRNMERRPLKTLLSMAGIGLACGILMVGRFQEGSVDYLIKVQFGLAQRDDLTVTFIEPTSRRVLHDLEALPGVYLAEPMRVAGVRLHRGHASHRTTIQGLAEDGDLFRILDEDLRVIAVPPEGLVLGDYLAEILDVRIGDSVEVELLEGRRERLTVPVTGMVREFTGASAYMRLDALNRILREGSAVSGAYLAVDPEFRGEVLRRLKDSPRVAGVTDRQAAILNFYDTMADMVLTFAFFSTLLAGSIAFGVVYNSARIALTERSREMASLRVLGFTRGEIGFILLGEMAVLTIAAIPVGFLIGIGLIAYIVQGIDSELYRIPMILEPRIFSFAATVILVASAVSWLVVARRLKNLDLVGVLKSRN